MSDSESSQPSEAPSESEEEYSASEEEPQDEDSEDEGASSGGEEAAAGDAGGGGDAAAAAAAAAEEEEEDVEPTQAQLEERRQQNIRALVSGAPLEVRRAALMPRLLTVQQAAVVLRRPFKSTHPNAPAVSDVSSECLPCGDVACLAEHVSPIGWSGRRRLLGGRRTRNHPPTDCPTPPHPAGPEAQAGGAQGLCALGWRQVHPAETQGATARARGAAGGAPGRRRRRAAAAAARGGAAAGRGAAGAVGAAAGGARRASASGRHADAGGKEQGRGVGRQSQVGERAQSRLLPGLPARLPACMPRRRQRPPHNARRFSPAVCPPRRASRQFLRPHQREGVQFMFECVCGLRKFGGQGCILADDMVRRR